MSEPTSARAILLFRRNIRVTGLSKGPSVRRLGLALICLVRLFRAAIEVGTLFNSQRFVTNVAYNMRLRPERDIAALDRSLDSAVYDHVFGNDASDNVSLRRDNERSAMKITLYLTIDLDQPICRDMS
jgi:hypothetical protein